MGPDSPGYNACMPHALQKKRFREETLAVQPYSIPLSKRHNLSPPPTNPAPWPFSCSTIPKQTARTPIHRTSTSSPNPQPSSIFGLFDPDNESKSLIHIHVFLAHRHSSPFVHGDFMLSNNPLSKPYISIINRYQHTLTPPPPLAENNPQRDYAPDEKPRHPGYTALQFHVEPRLSSQPLVFETQLRDRRSCVASSWGSGNWWWGGGGICLSEGWLGSVRGWGVLGLMLHG